MRRIWVDNFDNSTSGGLLDDLSYHHAIHVCRFKKGDEFEILSGTGIAYKVRLIEVSKKTAHVDVLGTRALPVPSKPFVGLALSLPRFSTFEWILEKSVELGVERIQPLISDYSFVKKESDISVAKIERWSKIVKSATEQTGRGDLMAIDPVIPIQKFINGINQDKESSCLFLFEGAGVMALKEAVREAKKTSINRLWALVGSEGGFSPQEVTYLNNSGFSPVKMGEQILRTETACVAVTSIIKYELDQLN